MIGYTIVGGFLGSGKTTLINSILANAATNPEGGERIAVIVNDLGEINIDAALIAQATDDTVELTNGCVCCSIGDSLATTLRDLCLREVPPERIVLECSGAAEPGPVAAYGSRKVLAEPTIVVTADATDVQRRAEDARFAALVRAQLSSADLIAVTKGDLVEDGGHGAAEWLRKETRGAVILGRPDDLGAVLPSGEPDLLEINPGTTSATALNVRSYPVTGMTLVELEQHLTSINGLVRAKGFGEVDGVVSLIQWSAGRLIVDPWRADQAHAPGLVTISS